ncbi:hypothetical protein LEP1GSC088_1539 [Leptospira interrogans str. L1207]|nr:hypothetical protein LEP1GSC088_1539 [Leptospira interrogans str. L1207]
MLFRKKKIKSEILETSALEGVPPPKKMVSNSKSEMKGLSEILVAISSLYLWKSPVSSGI